MIRVEHIILRRLVSLIAGLLVGLVGLAAQANVVLELDQSTLRQTGGDDWSIDVVIRLDDIGDADLTSPPQVAGINMGVAFSPITPGLGFAGASAPTSDAIFGATASYNTSLPGSPFFASVLHSNVINDSSDPVLRDNGKVLSLDFIVPQTITGTTFLSFMEDSSITFLSLHGGGNMSFDGFQSAKLTAIPEPNSWALLSLVFAAALSVRYVNVQMRKRTLGYNESRLACRLHW